MSPIPARCSEIGGADVALPLTPGDFRRLGIAFVHQHLGLVPSMTRARKPADRRACDRARAGASTGAREATRARALFARFGMALDPHARRSRR